MTAPGLSEQELAEIDAQVAAIVFAGITQRMADAGFPEGRDTGMLPKYQPTRDPAEGMRLLVKYLLTVGPRTLVPEFGETQQEWYACALNSPFNAGSQIGPTPCIAICRAVIAHGAPK